jgi:hypothetical protein
MMIQGSYCRSMIFILLCDETLRKWACCYRTGVNHRLRLGITFPIGLFTGQVAGVCSYILQMEAADSPKVVVKHSIPIRGDRPKTGLTSTYQQPRFRRCSVTHSGTFTEFQMNLVSPSAGQNSQAFRRNPLPPPSVLDYRPAASPSEIS